MFYYLHKWALKNVGQISKKKNQIFTVFISINDTSVLHLVTFFDLPKKIKTLPIFFFNENYYLSEIS